MTERQSRVLVVDDEPNTLMVLAEILKDDGYEVMIAESAEAGLELLKTETVDVLVSDYRMPGLDGIELLDRVHADYPDIPFIMMTAYGSIEKAVQAVKKGAYNYLTKPVNYDELAAIISRACESRLLKQENRELKRLLARAEEQPERIIYKSSAIRRIMDMVRRISRTTSTVLITGETGTGKELVAEAVHDLGPRADKPIIKINCAALPENLLESELFGHERGAFTDAYRRHIGRFEQAHGGTIFLDEIGDMTPATQAKILRVLQERSFERIGGGKTISVDVHIIAATNKNLERAIIEGRFREDLYYRLKVITLDIPPLRDRIEDIPLVALHFLQRYASMYNKDVNVIGPDAMRVLKGYAWPGNVRELKNVVERAVIISTENMIEPDVLPAEIRAGASELWPSELEEESLEQAVARLEKHLILKALNQCDWRQSRAAELLRTKRSTLIYKMKKHKII